MSHDRRQTPTVCPHCGLALTERLVNRVEGQGESSDKYRVVLLSCGNGHEFAWREGLSQLLPRRE